jgi:hypothetical protein
MYHRQPPAMVVVINFAGVPSLGRPSADVTTNHTRSGAGAFSRQQTRSVAAVSPVRFVSWFQHCFGRGRIVVGGGSSIFWRITWPSGLARFSIQNSATELPSVPRYAFSACSFPSHRDGLCLVNFFGNKLVPWPARSVAAFSCASAGGCKRSRHLTVPTANGA